MMIPSRPRLRSTFLATLLVGAAALNPGALQGQADATEFRVMLAQGPQGPQLTRAYETIPTLVNPEEFARTIDRSYPPALKARGTDGITVLWVFVDDAGRVRNARVHESSGHAAFDDAALSLIRQARFAPAESEQQPAPVWIELRIPFGLD